jgi:hypothetical protein
LLQPSSSAPALPPRAEPVAAAAPVAAPAPTDQAERKVNTSPRNPLSTMAVVHRVKLPSGLTVRADAGPMRLVGSSGAVMLLAYLAVIGIHVGIALDFTRRLGAAEDRTGEAEVWGDRSVPMLVMLGGCYLVAMAMTAWWTYRVSANNELLGEAGTAPLFGAATCFVPVAWFGVPFNQIRTSARADTSTTLWQLTFTAPFAAAWFILRFFTRSERYERANGGVGRATILREMQGAMIVSWAFVGFLTLAVVCATWSVVVLGHTYREIDTHWEMRLEAAAMTAGQ